MTGEDWRDWRDMYLSLAADWAAVCDYAGVEGDESPAEVVAALRSRSRGRLRISVPEDHGADGTIERWTAETDVVPGSPYTYSTIGYAVRLDWEPLYVRGLDA